MTEKDRPDSPPDEEREREDKPYEEDQAVRSAEEAGEAANESTSQ